MPTSFEIIVWFSSKNFGEFVYKAIRGPSYSIFVTAASLGILCSMVAIIFTGSDP